jgi:hypothetical protein
MNAGIIVLSLGLIVVFFTWQWFKYSKQKGGEASLQPPNAKENVFPAGKNNNVWWINLTTLEQLNLALALTQKALPVWEKYTASVDASYQDSATMHVVKIEKELLQKTIMALQLRPELLNPTTDKKSVYHVYFSFVSPVLAMQDGNWSPPYAVKKIFSSVYYILKSIMEQDGGPVRENYLQLAINQALDSLDISRLYSPEEIHAFLEAYKNKS